MDKQGIIVIGLILVAWMGWSYKHAQDVKKWRDEHPELVAPSDGTAPEQSATVAAPQTRAAPQAPPDRQDLPKHPHVDGIELATPQHHIALTTQAASLDALTFTEILDTPYVPVGTRADDKRERTQFLVLRPP